MTLAAVGREELAWVHEPTDVTSGGAVTRTRLAIDTSHFTVRHLQPAFLLSLAWNTNAAWYREHWASYRSLLVDHSFGTVVLGFSLALPHPCGFFTADALDVEGRVRPYAEGTRLRFDMTVAVRESVVAKVMLTLLPVRVTEPESLAAEPAALPDDLLRQFPAATVIEDRPPRPVPALERLVYERPLLTGEHVRPFRIFHSGCEVAEQWAYAEVARLAEAARESLALDHAADAPRLRIGGTGHVVRMDGELRAPYYVFDEGATATSVVDLDDRIVLLHRLRGPAGDHGCVVEQVVPEAG